MYSVGEAQTVQKQLKLDNYWADIYGYSWFPEDDSNHCDLFLHHQDKIVEKSNRHMFV